MRLFSRERPESSRTWPVLSERKRTWLLSARIEDCASDITKAPLSVDGDKSPIGAYVRSAPDIAVQRTVSVPPKRTFRRRAKSTAVGGLRSCGCPAFVGRFAPIGDIAQKLSACLIADVKHARDDQNRTLPPPHRRGARDSDNPRDCSLQKCRPDPRLERRLLPSQAG
jgi:hypothetical protein